MLWPVFVQPHRFWLFKTFPVYRLHLRNFKVICCNNSLYESIYICVCVSRVCVCKLLIIQYKSIELLRIAYSYRKNWLFRSGISANVAVEYFVFWKSWFQISFQRPSILMYFVDFFRLHKPITMHYLKLGFHKFRHMFLGLSLTNHPIAQIIKSFLVTKTGKINFDYCRGLRKRIK
jgi:hypothetical protein